MSDFVAKYQLHGSPDQGWRDRLESLASSSSLIVSASIVGSQAIIRCHVPEYAAENADAIAKAFFYKAIAALTDPSGGSLAHLLSYESLPPPSLLKRTALGVLAVGALICLGFLVVPTLKDVSQILHIAVAALAGFTAAILSRAKPMTSETALNDRNAEISRFIEVVVKNEDQRLRARLEAARVFIRMRTERISEDSYRHWKSSVWAFRSAFAFFLAAISGVGAAITFLLRAGSLDWHLMLCCISLAAVSVPIGIALLRHDAKLRERYNESAHDMFTLLACELALDVARLGSQYNYDAALQQIITRLLTLPSATSRAALADPGGMMNVESQAAITAVATKLVDAVIVAMGKTK